MTQYVEFIRSCITQEQVDNLEVRIEKSNGFVPEPLRIALSNQRTIIYSDNAAKQTHLVTTVESVNYDALAREAAEKKDKIKDLDFLLQMCWRAVTPRDFESSIKFMETALYFDCLETAENIKHDLRRSNPFTWSAYVADKQGDFSSADGSNNR